ncbi:phage DNA ejection protein [Symbiopectobacterium purcellii]|uniref:DNA transfer protein n=1 Tax=Symbiopectobacterium purcellii TaxID=2871826 RepID=A0ABX9ARW3_9ENTR|nr:phage DNA ejection protein [Symbiopectobacterium purcellii]QZN97778.1 DNA transfer protein [Symbiopectobacterium purcellii]
MATQFGGLQGLGAPVNYYGMIPDFRAEALQETQNRLGQQQVIGEQMKNVEMQRQLREQNELRQALPGAMNDPAKLQALAIKYPSQLKNIQAQLGFKNAQDVDATEKAVNALQQASSLGPEAVANALVRHAGVIQQKGATPQQLMQMWAQSPEQFNNFIGTVKLGTLGAKDQFEVRDKQQGRVIDQARLAETERSNRAGEAAQWANIGIAQQNVNVRKLELQDKALDRQIARETNQVQLGVLQDKRATTQRELEQAKTDKADAYNTSMDTMSRTIDTANKVLNSPGFTGYFGVNLMPGTNRWIPGTDAADTSALVDTLKSQGFMSGIQQMRGMGALSNAEGQKVMDAIGNLSASQSEKSARASIKAIIDTTQMAQKRLQQKYGKDIPAQSAQQQSGQPQSQAGFSSLWGD